MPSDVSYIEIGTSDASRTRVFLEQLFGWDFHLFGRGGDGYFQTPTLKAGLHGDDPCPGFVVFFGVPSLDTAMAEVTRLGGSAESVNHELGFGRFGICRDPRYGRVNEHNGWVPRDSWLDDWEKQAIIAFHLKNPLEGYRRLTFMMLDGDIVAVSPSSLWRVLGQAGLLRKCKGKPSKKGSGFEQPPQPHQHWHIDVSYINLSGTFYTMSGETEAGSAGMQPCRGITCGLIETMTGWAGRCGALRTLRACAARQPPLICVRPGSPSGHRADGAGRVQNLFRFSVKWRADVLRK